MFSTAVHLPLMKSAVLAIQFLQLYLSKRLCQLYLKSHSGMLALDEPKLSFLELCLCRDIAQNRPQDYGTSSGQGGPSCRMIKFPSPPRKNCIPIIRTLSLCHVGSSVGRVAINGLDSDQKGGRDRAHGHIWGRGG